MYYRGIKDLAGLEDLRAAAPKEYDAWAALDGIVGSTDGEIPQKYRELIAIAVAHTTQCPYCIEVHSKGAKQAGATKAELTEALFIAAALRSSAAAVHGTLASRVYDEC